ncbi:MAG TPA: helix-turn-helix transcriptional regulator [Puia sp.]|jgi:plasmid maintenance system antidote protein VapI|nr:helix-turn-helix transcriptional regulator [Puia sp.]
MNNLKEKLSKLASEQPSDWKEKAQYRRENREWQKKSAAIAVRVLDALKAQNLSQKDLAERMNISPQQISKIVKGQENLTLETISNLESALGIQILDEKVVLKRSSAKPKKQTALSNRPLPKKRPLKAV